MLRKRLKMNRALAALFTKIEIACLSHDGIGRVASRVSIHQIDVEDNCRRTFEANF